MNKIDSYHDAKEMLKSVRAIELRFDKILKNKQYFTLMQDGLPVGTVYRDVLTDKCIAKLDSLAEMEIK